MVRGGGRVGDAGAGGRRWREAAHAPALVDLLDLHQLVAHALHRLLLLLELDALAGGHLRGLLLVALRAHLREHLHGRVGEVPVVGLHDLAAIAAAGARLVRAHLQSDHPAHWHTTEGGARVRV